MLVATAGHIDHGKTALIRALTGVETDRLPEEKARGISIDLGFAYWRPAAEDVIGFIDVPGHERYLRNMIAGVSGADFAMLVVAADDGVMPQTVEHLQILDLLGVADGLVAITKCDLASPARIAEVRREISKALAGTALFGAQLLEISSVSGAGIDQLGLALIAARHRRSAKKAGDHGLRIAIDRAFTVTGSGTVVTGTVVAGQIVAGSDVMLAPQGRALRVRGLESGGAKAEIVTRGQRCAVNLAGVEVGDVHRGDWLVDPALHAPSSRLEVRLIVQESRIAPLRHAATAQLHIGTAAIAARVLVPRQKSLQPGVEGVVQLVLDAPTSAVNGDRFVLRDPSGKALIGGGTVLNPLATAQRQSPQLREAVAAALTHHDAPEALHSLAAIPGFEIDTNWFERSFNIPTGRLAATLAQSGFAFFGTEAARAISRARFDQLCEKLIAALAQFHAAKPELGGMSRRALRQALGEAASADLLNALLRNLTAQGRVLHLGALVRLPDHSPSFSPAETAAWRSTLAMLEDSAPRPIVIAELVRELRASEAAVAAMLQRRRANGDVWQVSETRYMLREHVAALAASAAQLDRQSDCGFTAAQFRDATGIGRNFVIQLLEFFDRIGVTRRIGEVRRMRLDYKAITGSA